jgi:hypothetical protein
VRWLECGKALPLRAPPAGLLKFGTAFGERKKNRESPPSASDASEFRTQVRPQPSAQPRLFDLAGGRSAAVVH